MGRAAARKAAGAAHMPPMRRRGTGCAVSGGEFSSVVSLNFSGEERNQGGAMIRHVPARKGDHGFGRTKMRRRLSMYMSPFR